MFPAQRGVSTPARTHRVLFLVRVLRGHVLHVSGGVFGCIFDVCWGLAIDYPVMQLRAVSQEYLHRVYVFLVSGGCCGLMACSVLDCDRLDDMKLRVLHQQVSQSSVLAQSRSSCSPSLADFRLEAFHEG